MAAVLTDLHREPEALALVRAVTGERAQDLGLDHPATLEATATLASLLSASGEQAEAERMYDDLLPRLVQRFGRDDGRTLDARVGLARVHHRFGRPDDAEPVLREVLAKRRLRLRLRLRLGDNYPDTLAVQTDPDSVTGPAPEKPARWRWRRRR
ncbi:tetratricopeptide repeat protein [Streptomyces sp. NPDC058232]|uniref:tetratricopeptide repeat protein n=1 Tax=Streptomyces sp. NPDC058232 TaxID=3346393 RepID=UPI0036E2EB43